MKRFLLTIGLALTVLTVGMRAAAVPPNPVAAIFTYQGAIYVDDEPFDGTGFFKLVIVNESGESLWSNDGSSSSGSEPGGDIAVALDQSFFDIPMGDTSIAGMSEMDPAIFTADEKLYLRTWFSDGEHGFEEMTPAIQLTTSTFAINSQFLRGYGPDDFFLNSSQITSSQIAAGAVTSSAIAGGAVGTIQIADDSITGDKITAFSNNNTNFTVGRGVDETVVITAGTGAATDPGLRFNAATDAWQYSNDGVGWTDIGSGGGSGTVSSGNANELAFYAASGTTVSGLTTGNNGVLVTDGSGVPSISTQLPNDVMDNITRVGTVTSGTWQGNAIADTYVADNLTIDGGNVINTPINNSAIGGTTPADGTFRNLVAELDAVFEADAQVRGGDLAVGLGTTAYAGRVVLHDADAGDSFTTTIQSSADVPASFSLILPADDGDPDEVLTTDGSGNLSWSAVAGGDVTGPGSSTDNALPRFDGAGGKTLQNSGVIVDDGNNVSGVVALSIDSMGKDWTNAGRTIADLGAVTTVDINGGDIDGVDIGLNTAGKGTFTDVVASTFLVGTSNQGDILYDNGTSFVRLVPGTSGQFLQTQGAGANPLWANAAGGDVSGPASSTDSAVTRFDGTTGKLIQDSNVSVSDTGSINIPSGQSYRINGAALDQDDIGDGTTYKQYDPASVVITGGTIDSASVGATTASTGRFTTVESTVATGTAPLTVASTTLVSNLNADLLDGQSGSYYTDLANAILAGQAQGDILYFDGSNWARLAAGTSGEVLQTQGAGADPVWSAIGAGDVTGPGSSTDNAIARYDGTTGKLIQNSGVTIDDANNLSVLGDLTVTGDDLFMTTNTSGYLLVADGTNFNPIAVSGDVSIDGAGVTTVSDLTITGEAQGDILYFDGTNWLRLPAGTSGQFLQTQGAGANPSWATGATGDVVGPASSTDNAITRFDGTTGKLVQDSNVSVSDTGSINIPSGQSYRINGAALTQDDIGDGTTYKQYDPASVVITGGTVDGASVGGSTPAAGAFTTLSSSGQYTNTVAGGTAPMVITSNTVVTNLNADLLDGQEGNYYNDLANAVIASQAQGDILFFNGTGWARLPAGTSGQVLQTNGSSANPSWETVGTGVTSLNSLTGALSIANASGAGSTVTIDDASTAAKGIASFNSTNFSVSSGAVNTVQDIAAGSSPSFTGLTVSGLSSAGVVHNNASGVLSTSAVDLTTEVTGSLPIGSGGTGQTTQTAAFDALSPTTTKGDLVVDNGTNDIRLPVGTNDQVLVADSAEAAGVKWADAGSGDVVGPASSTDNAITRFDGTTGKLVQDSNVSVSDTGSINIPSGQSYRINGAALTQDDIGDGATYKQYDPASVAITGGTIDSASVGATTASTGRFTTVESTVATGTAPLTVASTTVVTNLNADLLDGQSGSYYNDLANATLAGQAQGDILYFNGSNWVRLPAGTSGYLLQTQGAGADPVWAAFSAPAAGTSANNTLRWNGTNWVESSALTNDDTNIVTSGDLTIGGDDLFMATNTAGYILVADGTNFNPIAMSGDVAIDGTGATTVSDLTITGEAQGDILYFDGSNWVRLAAGTSGQVLETQGAGANPQWGNAGTGDVVGPAGATDNALPRYDTATGKLIQNSGVIVDDSNDVSGIAALSIASMGQNWTNAGITVADLGTVTTADINGGTIDGTAIGATTPSTAVFGDGTNNAVFDVDGDLTFSGTSNFLVPGDAYAFRVVGAENYGVVFSATNSAYEFTDGSGNPLFSFGALGALVGALTIGNEANRGSLLLADNDASIHYAGIIAPALTATYALTLPTDTGTSGQVLSTDGGSPAASLSWVDRVAGPGSSTDNAVARFDGTGGDTIQNSGVTIDDNDLLTAATVVETDAHYFGYKTSNQALTGTMSNILIQTDVRIDSLYSRPNNGVVQVAAAGTYKIQADCGANVSAGNTRSIAQWQLANNGTLIPGSLAYSYHRNSADGEDSASITVISTLSANDQVSLQGREYSGGNNIQALANSCRLTIERI